ncbi:MAG: ArsA family ATPase [Proteobacteria bacterium]|nr:ArsA family ATPase [Pseudomonadota bacterium]
MTRVIVCCGVGGVGKTTTSAALAVRLAKTGHRAVVLTIDPARRLADALGVELGNEPRAVAIDAPGTLHALMLDRKATWDGIIHRFAPSAEAAQRLFDNRYYKAVSTRLGGSHEFMAMEKLYELVESERWDVVVVDTPPTQHALDFFRAPDRVHRVFDRSVIGILVEPGKGLFNAATRKVVGVLHRMAGERVIGDISEFFRLMSGLSTGFRKRSRAVADLLSSDRSHYWLVTSASAPARADAVAFLAELEERELTLQGFLVNRVIPDPGELAAERPADIGEAEWTEWGPAFDALIHARRSEAARHRAGLAQLAQSSTHASVHPLPDLGSGIADLSGLERLAEHLPDV